MQVSLNVRRCIALVSVYVMAAGAYAATNEVSWQNPKFDINGQGTWVIPTGDNDSEWVGAFELKGIYWASPRFGLGLSLGFGTWTTDEVEGVPPYSLPALEDDDSYLYISTMPIGGSLYFRPLVKKRYSLTAEAGIRYMAVWDDVNVELDGETEASDDDITIYIQHDGDADSGWVALLGLDFEYNIAGGLYAALGAGYQFDLSDQEYTLWDGEPQDLSFEGVAIRATLGTRL